MVVAIDRGVELCTFLLSYSYFIFYSILYCKSLPKYTIKFIHCQLENILVFPKYCQFSVQILQILMYSICLPVLLCFELHGSNGTIAMHQSHGTGAQFSFIHPLLGSPYLRHASRTSNRK